MPTRSSSDLDIINASRAAEEPARRDFVKRPEAVVRARTRYTDAFEALESGLEVDAAALEGGTSLDAATDGSPEPRLDRYDIEQPVPARADSRVPFKLAALVVVACATLGAATATLVLHDRVMQIVSSSLTAIR